MADGVVKTIREILFATGWSAEFLIGMGVLAGILILYLYRLERQMVRGGVGLLLLGLRLLLVASTVLMLGEPIFSQTRRHSEPATLLLLLDDSASMDVVDRGRSAGQLLREAEAAGLLPPEARPVRLEAAATALRLAARHLQDAGSLAAGRTQGRDLRLKALHAASRVVEDVVDQLEADAGRRTILSGATSLEINDIRSRLESRILTGLNKWIETLDSGDQQAAEGLDDWLAALQETLTSLIERLDKVAPRADQEQAEKATPDVRAAISEVESTTRRRQVRRLVTPRPGNWIDRLSQQVRLRTFRFSRTVEPVALPTATAGTTRPTTRPAEPDDPARLSTDLAAAIQQALSQAAEEKVNAVLLISDGQHNAPSDPLQVATQLTDHRIPLYTVPIGQPTPPRDALIRKVDAPRSLFLKDQLNIEALVETHGLTGRQLVVQLKENDKVLAEEKLTVAGPDATHTVRMTHQPGTVGRHVYELSIAPLEGEAFLQNNTRVLVTEVNQERTKVLVVEDQPRWEFRYLRNLLTRDEGIQLQYVLFSGGYIYQAPELPPVVAGVNNENPEADRLPQEQQQLDAFDVIVLGDVSPSELPRKTQQMIESFVSERGGTLIMVAGKRYMPGAYAAYPLAQLIPVKLSGKRSVTRPAAPARGLRLRLTRLGLETPMLSLAADPDRNQRIWMHFPALHWVSPYRQAQEAAEVLAWFVPATEPATRATTAAAGSEDRTNAAILRKTHGLGKVVYLTGEFTWRLRFRVGDRHHHRFWSQLLRWAGAGRLAGGTKTVRVGTDRDRYRVGQPLVVTAKLSRLDHTPVLHATVDVTAIRDGRPAASARMEPSAQGTGEYRAALADLAAGQYTLRVSGPEIEELLASEKLKPPVETMAIVDPAETVERDNVQCNRELLARIARAGGGDLIEPDGLETWADALDTAPLVTEQVEQRPLWNDYRWLIVFLALISLEWVIRKRAGLI